MIGIDHKLCMSARVLQPAVLFLMVHFLPRQVSARSAHGERCIQKDQQVWVRDFLPHALYIRMFLRDVPAGIAIDFESGGQGGLTRAAGTYDANE